MFLDQQVAAYTFLFSLVLAVGVLSWLELHWVLLVELREFDCEHFWIGFVEIPLNYICEFSVACIGLKLVQIFVVLIWSTTIKHSDEFLHTESDHFADQSVIISSVAMWIIRVLIPYWIFPLEYASAVHQIVFIEIVYDQSYNIVVMILFEFNSILRSRSIILSKLLLIWSSI